MNVKIDTREKFQVITLLDKSFPVNMTDEMQDLLLSCRAGAVKNVVLNLKNAATVDLESAEMLQQVQQDFYDQGYSFVICELQPAVETFLDENEILEFLNVTPTESEAWDIVQMEEIERELLGDEE
ncbi:MAG TPA: STAS domain-containing protein [Lacibacter sp.]|nr:STAS domain-containing protein [Lacibacter sp.]HMO89530.1 STAS domain-containing protein [Lacibacter sp.]HMP86013.1 STAS domain-containing protein [Lacibacter sp.]